MTRLLLWRLKIIIPMFLFVALGVQLLLDLAPGDPARIFAGEGATPEQVELTRVRLGLDEPLPTRFFDYLGGLLHLDAGTSLATSTPVFERIALTIPATSSLLLVAMALGTGIGVAAGVIAALSHGSWLDRLLSSFAAAALAIPPFVFGLVLVVPLAIDRSLLPATGYAPLSQGVGQWLQHLVLPGFALALMPASEVMRQMRGSLIDVMSQDYIRSLRAKGISEVAVVARHGIRNAAGPCLTVLGLQVGRMLGAAVVIEKAFGIPGFGGLSFDAVVGHDFPVVQGAVLVGAVVVLMSNLAVDVLTGLLNPKERTA